MRKQVARSSREPPARIQRKRSRRPSPPEETPPQPSAAPAGRVGLKGCGVGTAPALSEGWPGTGRRRARRRRPGPLPVSGVGGDGRTGLSGLWAAAARLRLCPWISLLTGYSRSADTGFPPITSPGSRGATRTMTSNAAMATVDWCPQLRGPRATAAPQRAAVLPARTRGRAEERASSPLPTLLPSPLGFQLLYSCPECA